jgi:hypothetical protein
VAASDALAQEPTATSYAVRTPSATTVNIGYSLVIQPGDGQNTVSVVNMPDHGQVTFPSVVSGTGQVFAYTPAAGYTGIDQFIFRVMDETFDVSFGIITINVGNIEATAENDDIVVPAMPDNFLDVLFNDLGFADPITFQVTQQPTHGTLTLETSTPAVQSLIGLFYTPTPGYTGPDQFQYQVSDGIDTDGATVQLTVSPDSDEDGLLDAFDNCPNAFNPEQHDGDEDGAGDDCDNCAGLPNPGQLNSDADAYGNSCDNCTLVTNPTQLDANGDGYGNHCDADLNNSGLTTATDFNLLRSVLNQACVVGGNTLACNADLNGSGLVTSTDFNILRSRMNTAPGPSGTVVP